MSQPKPSPTPFSWKFLRGVLLKAALLFVALNLLFALLYPMGFLGGLSLYNLAFPGRLRLPFGENQAKAYNLSLNNLPAMFASLQLNAPTSAAEYRVLLVGDSSVWGTLLRPQDTLAGQLNAANLTCGSARIQAYNQGNPTLKAAKDLLLLDEALRRYQPDRIVWLVTLEGLPRELQLKSPLLANNAERAEALIAAYHLNLDPAGLVHPSLWDKTIIGARRPLADLARLQFYGALWGATGIDQTYPDNYEPAARDLDPDLSFHGRQPPILDASSLALDVLSAGATLAAQHHVALTFVNEPILISRGKNSDLRYNFFYPRWAYDQYRQVLQDFMQKNNYSYADAWDAVPEAEFTNSAIHLTPAGESLLTARVGSLLQSGCQK